MPSAVTFTLLLRSPSGADLFHDIDTEEGQGVDGFLVEVIKDYFGWPDLSAAVTETPHDGATAERIFVVSLSTPEDDADLALLDDDDGFTYDVAFQVESAMDEGEIEASITVDETQAS